MISSSDNDSPKTESNIDLVYAIDDANQEHDNLMLRKSLLEKMVKIFRANDETSEKRKEIDEFKLKVI